MSGFKQKHIHCWKKAIWGQNAPSPVCAWCMVSWQQRLSCDSLLNGNFLEQRGEDVNKSWINKWISWELRTGRSAGPSDSY